MHQHVGGSQTLVEEALIGFELERVRLHAGRIRDHAIGGDDGETFDDRRPCPWNAKGGHRLVGRPRQSFDDASRYSTVRITLEVGRVLTVGSFCSFLTISSYSASGLTGSLALHVHDLVAARP